LTQATKVILIHGIGNHKPTWAEQKEAYAKLGVPQEDVITFYYEDLLEKSAGNLFLKMAAKAAVMAFFPHASFATGPIMDYINDILIYIPWPYKTRNKIIAKLVDLLKIFPNAIVVGHSLGSLVAYDAFKWSPTMGHDPSQHTFISVGSPIGGPVIEEILERMGFHSPKEQAPENKFALKGLVKKWINIYGTLDPISGKIDKEFQVDKQLGIRNTHAVSPYLRAAAPFVANT
jgi:pimeloyl-ACP methyl ester carboxylesterase